MVRVPPAFAASMMAGELATSMHAAGLAWSAVMACSIRLATGAGVTEDYLSQIERGLKTPTIALLHRFSKILGVRISELLGESAAEHSEAAIPAGKAVQRALMAH
jgi:transcriptional regulator with XRE-family HTH domain